MSTEGDSMYNNIEKELKVQLTREQYEKALRLYDPDEVIVQTNTYYEDPDNRIYRKYSGALRIRTIGDRNILTIKKTVPGSEDSKYEYECDIHTSDPKSLNAQEISFIKDHFPDLRFPLHPIARFTTTRNLIEFENAELCIDQTDFDQKSDYELEYEYKKPHDGYTVLEDILNSLGISDPKKSPSKLARALAYAESMR